jgi:hypothetical protein
MREPFLLAQPLWYAKAEDDRVRWSMGVAEADPVEGASEESPHLGPVRNHVQIDDDNFPEVANASWVRVRHMSYAGTTSTPWQDLTEREKWIEIAISQLEHWRRVALVCGAGLGKTTNLKWLAWTINRLDNGRNKNLAMFLELRELAELSEANSIPEKIFQWVSSAQSLTDAESGRLLDSLDQADPSPKGSVVANLISLMKGPWGKCRIWISGRPYAFREADSALWSIAGQPAWQFFRIGPLDEPEACELVESVKRPTAG